MKRKYADLHLIPSLNDLHSLDCLIDKASELGYHLVAASISRGTLEEEIQKLGKKCSQENLDFASRVDLKPRTPGQLLHDLRAVRRKFEIVAVECESKNVARQAAKDRRVDLLNFPSIDFHRRFFDRAEAELASSSLSALELDMKPLLTFDGTPKIRFLSSLRREVAIAKDFGVPVVLSSGASNALLMRKPKEFAVLASLFDFDEASALRAVSENPVSIVDRNRQKLSWHFVAPGIRVMRRGRDCEKE
jgi:RNase P/RNase MRP subunit p30